MPIFFMLPFIILQGMIDVMFDDISSRPDTAVIEKTTDQQPAIATRDFP